MNYSQITERLRTIVDRSAELAELADITDEQQAEFDALGVEHKKLLAEKRRYDEVLERVRREAGGQPGDLDRPVGFPWADGRRPGRAQPASGPTFRTADGKELRSYLPSERMAAVGNDGDAPLSVGRCIRAAVTGKVDELSDAERRGLLAGTDTGGGYLVSTKLSNMILDGARSASVALKAGVRTMPVDGPTTIVQILSDPTAHWRAELQRITASEPTFGAVNIKPKTVAVLVPCSVELWEDSANIEQAIEMSVFGALGLAVDRAILMGSGSESEPLGIQNTAGVNTLSDAGAPTDWSTPHEAITRILQQNFPHELERLSWLLNPTIASEYAGLVSNGESGDGQPLAMTPWVARVPQLYTTSFELYDSTKYRSILGDFNETLLAVRQNIRFEVFRSGSGTDADGATINAVSDLAVWLRFYLRLDVACLRPSWYTVIPGHAVGGA